MIEEAIARAKLIALVDVAIQKLNQDRIRPSQVYDFVADRLNLRISNHLRSIIAQRMMQNNYVRRRVAGRAFFKKRGSFNLRPGKVYGD